MAKPVWPSLKTLSDIGFPYSYEELITAIPSLEGVYLKAGKSKPQKGIVIGTYRKNSAVSPRAMYRIPKAKHQGTMSITIRERGTLVFEALQKKR